MAGLRSQVPQRTMPRDYPPAAVDGIRRVGVVCELGYGQNEDDIRILSLAARSLIDAVVVERTSEAVSTQRSPSNRVVYYRRMFT